jgi:hypothetical protein
MTEIPETLRTHREDLAVRHIDAENRNDTQTALKTFT